MTDKEIHMMIFAKRGKRLCRWESQATHSEIGKHMSGKWTFQDRRWRLETDTFNSSLLTLKVARNSQTLYGGVVVEVIPKMERDAI